MWLSITLISMLVCAVSEITGKKVVSTENEYNILKLRISAIFVDAVLLVLLWVFCYRGTGTNPWIILLDNPLIIVSTSLNVLETFFYLQALKYIGLTIQEAYSGTSSILFFVGMVFINLVFGKIADVRSLFVPSKLIIIAVLLTASFILPRLNSSEENEAEEISNLKKRNVVIGLLFTFAGIVFDAVECLIATYIFAENDISSIDCMSAGSLVALFWGVVFYAILYSKTRKTFNPFKKGNSFFLIYGVLNAAWVILYFYGTSLSPVKSSIFWVAYPIFPIIGSAVLLKERYSVKQYICIALIALSSISFGLLDYIAK